MPSKPLPAQRLIIRRTKNLLLMYASMLEPLSGCRDTHTAPDRVKVKQAKYYDRNRQKLFVKLTMRLPGEDSWSKGKVLKKVGTPSPTIREVHVYRYKRRHELATYEQLHFHPVTIHRLILRRQNDQLMLTS